MLPPCRYGLLDALLIRHHRQMTRQRQIIERAFSLPRAVALLTLATAMLLLLFSIDNRAISVAENTDAVSTGVELPEQASVQASLSIPSD